MYIPFYAPHYQVEKKMRDAEVFYTLPALPANVVAKVIYPFGTTVARVIFFRKEAPEKNISTYLDAFDQLGFVGQPYFEIYPNEDGDISRFLMNEEAEMYAEVFRLLEAM